MKGLIGFLFLAGPLAHAQVTAPGFELVCANSPASDVYEVINNGDHMKVRISHRFGTDYMPVFDGIVAENDLKIIAKYAPILKSLGSNQEFTFPVSGCERKSDFVLKCSDYKDAPSQKMGGHTVRALSFYTNDMHEEVIGASYEVIQLNLYLEVDGETYFLPMRYTPADCRNPGNDTIKK